MSKILCKIADFFSRDESTGEICFNWDNSDTEQYDTFTLKHLDKCGVSSPWICFKYVDKILYKKLVCSACGEEYVMNNKNL